RARRSSRAPSTAARADRRRRRGAPRGRRAARARSAATARACRRRARRACMSRPTRRDVASRKFLGRFPLSRRRRTAMQRRSEDVMEEMLRQTDQIVSFANELNRRMAEAGVTGVDGLVHLYDQLRSALGKISSQEIEWAQAEVSRVVERLKK